MVVIVVVLGIDGVVVVEGRSRRQTTDACVCVPNTQCYSEDAGWWHCPNFGELCCDEAYIAPAVRGKTKSAATETKVFPPEGPSLLP